MELISSKKKSLETYVKETKQPYLDMGIDDDKLFVTTVPVITWSLDKKCLLEMVTPNDKNTRLVIIELLKEIKDLKKFAEKINKSEGIIIINGYGKYRFAYVPTFNRNTPLFD